MECTYRYSPFMRLRIAPPAVAVLLSIILPVGLIAPSSAGDSSKPVLGIADEWRGVVALTDAHLVISPDRHIPRGTLVIRDGRVLAAAEGRVVPAGALEVNLDGLWIYPGLIDPFTEYGLEHLPPLYEKSEAASGTPVYEKLSAGPGSWNDAVHPQREWVHDFRPDRKRATQLLEAGITTVQSARWDGILQGRAFVASLAEDDPGKLILRPQAHLFASFNKGSSRQSYPASMMGAIALLRQVFLDSQWYESSKSEDIETNTALEALADHEAIFLFKSTDEHTLLRAARVFKEFDKRAIYVGSGREYRRLADISSMKLDLVLPLTLPQRPTVGSPEDDASLALGKLKHWASARFNAADLVAEDLRVAFTTAGMRDDEDLWKNLRLRVEAGLPPTHALAAVTTEPARMLGISEIAGDLEPGKRADFLIASGDLLSGEEELLEVWIDGRRALVKNETASFRLQGRYDVLFAKAPAQLDIERERKSIHATLIRDSKEWKAKVLGTMGSWYFEFKPKNGNGDILRMTLNRVGNEWFATLSEDGRLLRVPVQKRESSPRKGRNEPDDLRESGRITAAARAIGQTLPDGPFGLEELPRPRTVLFRGATVWTADRQGVMKNTDLLIAGGKIVEIGQDISAPRDAEVIESTGKHISPGIIDEHSHLAISGRVNEASHSVTSEVRIGDVIDPDDIGIYRALAGGVTTAHLLHGSANVIGGQCQVIKLRWGKSAEEMKFSKAAKTIKFALGENVKQSNWGDRFTTRYPQSRMGVEAILRDALERARAYGKRVRAFEKSKNNSEFAGKRPRRDLQLEALLEVLESRRDVHCHSYVQSEILMLMRLAEEYGFRIKTFTHILEGYKVATEMAEHGASASTFSDWWAYKFEVYDAIPYNVCLLREAGVLSSLNSDSDEVIRRLHHQAAKAVMYCDMSEAEGMELITINPAAQLGVDRYVGSLTPGKDADIVVWNGPPLDTTSIVEQTWIDGALYFDRERHRLMAARDSETRRRLLDLVLERKRDDDRRKRKEQDFDMRHRQGVRP